ncbi:MAG: SLBB domain-containing protein [Frankiaceae bacterium]|nr:SLBB domain-containing protein [Frankiaceae bacterium]
MTTLTAGRLLAPAPHWSDHITRHGLLPSLTAAQLLDAADAVDVGGRGGGGFPLSRKLRAAAEHGRGTVIGNCAEGEPASHKDDALLDATPHLVIDGLLLAARATNARRVVLAAHEGTAARRLRSALGQRDDVGRVEVLELPHRYVAGEASALVRALNGGPSLPQQRRAPLATGRRPHLVQNAETLACLALLARGHRVDTSLVTMGGAVVQPGVLEVGGGTTVREAVRQAGGYLEPVQAMLVGGYFGRWLAADLALDAPLTLEGMRAVGGSLGAGIVLALPSSACGLAATAEVLRYLADQSARQCGPCLNGLPAMASALERLAAGDPPPDVAAQLERWADLVRGRGACAHPDGAAALLTSALQVFATDVEQHLTRPCGRPAGRWLEVPR